MNIETRIDIEKRIATAAVESFIAAGCAVSVDDGEDVVLKKSVDVAAIIKAMFSTDEDRLIVWRCPTADGGAYQRIGWVMFTYGNDGWDVISDNTVNLEEMLKSATALADELEVQHG